MSAAVSTAKSSPRVLRLAQVLRLTTLLTAVLVAAAACARGGNDTSGSTTDTTTSDRAQPGSQATASPSASESAGSAVTGTVVRFQRGSAQVDVTIDRDSPAVRDFLSMLPLTVELSEFAGREKVADLPRPLNYRGTPGSDPEDGDLIYFTPWDNLGFYYDASGIEYSDQTLHLGTYRATADQLGALEGRVTVRALT